PYQRAENSRRGRLGFFEALLPLIGRCHDLLEIVVARSPVESLLELRWIGDDFDQVSGSPSSVARRQLVAGDVRYGIDHLANGKPRPVAAIERSRLPPTSEMLEGRRMRVHQIGDMDIVANGGAISG